MDPDATLKFLPPYTKSVIQPMDQGLLWSIKARAKKAFYQKMFNYCEQHPDEYTALDDFCRFIYVFVDLYMQYTMPYTILQLPGRMYP